MKYKGRHSIERIREILRQPEFNRSRRTPRFPLPRRGCCHDRDFRSGIPAEAVQFPASSGSPDGSHSQARAKTRLRRTGPRIPVIVPNPEDRVPQSWLSAIVSPLLSNCPSYSPKAWITGRRRHCVGGQHDEVFRADARFLDRELERNTRRKNIPDKSSRFMSDILELDELIFPALVLRGLRVVVQFGDPEVFRTIQNPEFRFLTGAPVRFRPHARPRTRVVRSITSGSVQPGLIGRPGPIR